MKKSPLFVFLFAGVFFAITACAADREGDQKVGGDPGGPKPEANRDQGGAKPEGDRNGNPVPPPNPQDKKVAKVFVAYDGNGDGAVSDEEIVAMMEGKQNTRGKREISDAVGRADKDNDGVLSFDEFKWWYETGRLDDRAKNR